MSSRSALGLVLRLNPVGESDILLDVFTKEIGRLKALAKGGLRSKKRFTGLLLTGHLLDLSLSPGKKGADLWRLEGARLKADHLGLRQDYLRFLAAGPVREVLLRATAPFDPHPGALELALLTLARLAQAEKKSEMASALLVFLARLLKELGYGLSLQACIACGRPAEPISENRLSLAGGLVCPNCAGSRARGLTVPAPPGMLKGLQAAADMPAPALLRLRFPPALLPPGLLFLGRFWQEISGHDLPSLALAQKALV